VSRRATGCCALFAAIALGLFVRLDAGPSRRASEERCYAVVGEMVRSGDWLLPRLNGALRLQKPPLFYWAGALAAELAGGPSLWSLRSVSAACALALAACLFAVGRSLADFRTGMLATGALGASVLFYDRGRIGDAEMLLALLVFGALALFERLWRTRDPRLLPALALLVGLGFLTKATAALLGIFAPIAAWLVIHDRVRLALRPAVLAWGLVAVALGLSWYAVILWRVPGSAALLTELLLSPFGVQVGGDARHLRELWYYWPRFPLSSAPTGLLLPWLAWEFWRTRFFRDEPRLQFFATSFWVLLLAWTFVPQKQIHYLLPLVPLQALVAGRLVAKRFFSARA
jgi:4-amino-4-deoxy-L-arabinose transferase-like glycosyltransferase